MTLPRAALRTRCISMMMKKRDSSMLASYVLTWLVLLARTMSVDAIIECGIYLAKSTIPGAGYGMFNGNRTLNIGDRVAPHADIVVPIYGIDWHNENEHVPFLWDEYIWKTSIIDNFKDDYKDHKVDLASAGIGAVPNSVETLVNADESDDSILQATAIGASSLSPTAGSYTPFYGRIFDATESIGPGKEIYISYGIAYFSSRWESYGHIPMGEDFEKADNLLRKYQAVALSGGDLLSAQVAGDGTSNWSVDLYQTMMHVKETWSGTFSSRVLAALPSNRTAIDDVLNSGGTAKQHYNESTRSLEWLDENGKCMDNIRDGISTIVDAGRGAFATRAILEGNLVAPAPMIHIANKSRLQMFDKKRNSDGKYIPDTGKGPVQQQLLLNYCLGHSKSSLLLCPYASLTQLINHSRDKANVKLVWSSMAHPEWKEQPIREWGDKLFNGLDMDYIALRDIAEGEEIFLDYGPEWEMAWQLHVERWTTPRKNYTPAYELNAIVDLEIPTWYENPMETNGVTIMCQTRFMRYAKRKLGARRAYPCRILSRRNKNSYTVELIRSAGLYDVCGWFSTGDIIFDMPRDAFVFHDIPGERDHHKKWSFRHEAMIPDDMFPEVWKNIDA